MSGNILQLKSSKAQEHTGIAVAQEPSEHFIQLSKALGDSLRVDILQLLRTGSFGVLELCRILDIRQNTLSHHLKVLNNAGLISRRREGNSIFYRRALLLPEEPFYHFRQESFAAIDQLALRPELEAGIQLIHQERSEQSLVFFERNAERFRQQQELVAEYAHYRDTLHALLNGLNMKPDQPVMEVGPGEGQLLSELAGVFSQVIALDNSLEMLNLARNTVSTQQQKNVEFIHGDTRTAISRGIHCDLLIYNMVLHHIPSPWEAFQDSAQILTANGSLLLIDLSHHDQDWVRDACGDLWLGFEDHELDSWAADAGLNKGQSMYLGLRNGFQVQMRVFTKPT